MSLVDYEETPMSFITHSLTSYVLAKYTINPVVTSFDNILLSLNLICAFLFELFYTN